MPAWSWTPVRLRVLAALVEADSLVWPQDLARSLDIPYGTVYDTLRRAYDVGWAVGITRKVSPSRPARVLYRLTEQGRAEAPALLRQADTDTSKET
jgi:DNA-binding PadR family transcriptional regulator